jgi:hypothetical protein
MMASMIRNVVIHLHNDQPFMGDLFEMPEPGDQTLRCTNLRLMNGKRPLFADDQHAIFYFPYPQIRFVEIPTNSLGEGDSNHLPVPVAAVAGGPNGADPAVPEEDLEIDEDFLRRIREV